MRLHEGKLREASWSFSFFLENSSNTPLIKKTSIVKGVTLLAVRIDAVAPLFSHVLGALLTWVTLFFNEIGALPAQNKEKLQGDNIFLHFSREKFEGLEQTRGYLSHNMMVMRFRCNIIPPKVWWLEGNNRHNTLKEQGIVSRQRSKGRNFSSITNFLQYLLHFDTCPKRLTTWLLNNTTQIHVR